MLQQLSHLISLHGYWLLAVFILMESAGVPLPGETALIVASASAGAGNLSIVWVILVAASAAITGDACGYWLGRRAGRPLLKRLRVKEKKLKRIESFFKKHGPKAVFFGRFISILRAYSALFAGVSRMRYGIFTAYNGAGGILWAFTFGIIGYIFGKNLQHLEAILHEVRISIVIVVVVVLAGVLLWRWFGIRKKVVRH
jgi:membrane protein DedA with SNARE-associated domain